jgi:serine/threonine-protein kinase
MGEIGLSSTNELPLPQLFGRLLLLRLIARGGMGDVFLAATTGIEGAERPCVVKTIRRDHIHDGSFVARFLDEARVQTQLCHPGVAQIIEASTDEQGEPYTVAEFIEGRSLAEVRQRASQLGVRLHWAEAAAVTLEIAQALAHVHERSGSDGLPLGIVHRDLSPQNVMVGYGGEVKLIDFGTARGHNRRCHTVAGVVFAKPGYVAPEVARQQVGDGRIDLYALGILLWEMCKGARFFSGNPQKHLEDAAEGRILVPSIAKEVDAPEALDSIVQMLCSNDPDDRYLSAARVVPDLAKLLAQAPPARNGERGVRPRITALMHVLFPQEPARCRADFARLLKEAAPLRQSIRSAFDLRTPAAGKVSQELATQMTDPSMLAGTPYRLGPRLGEGSSGVVYEAEHVELGRRVALKLLSPEHASATDAVDRFRREARAVAKLSHPNLVGLYDFGKALDGRVFLAMELLSGETLERHLARDGAFPWRDAVQLAIEVCRALEAAHGAALVHRDIKPANLFLTNTGDLKLLDFGVAMALADTALNEQRQKGFAIFGTPEYMAPEQISGERVDGRCDLYALACVLYELVTGTPVFEGDSSVVVMGKQLRDKPEPPRQREPGLPVGLEAVIMRGLSKKPDNRYASASLFREALEAVLAAPVLRRERARRRALGVLAAAVSLAIAGGYARSLRAEAVEGTPIALTTVLAAPSVVASPSAAVEHSPVGEPVADRRRNLVEARAAAKTRMGDPSALKKWAMAAHQAGEWREARRAVHAWALRDGTAEPRLLLASVLEGSGKSAEGRAVLLEWLEVHPDSAAVRQRLASWSEGGRGQIARR